MEVLPQLVPRALIQMSPAELHDYYRTITENVTIEQQERIVAHIITQVHDAAIPPSIFGVWLSLILHRSPHLLKPVLLDPKSQYIRKAGLKRLSRAFRKPYWKREAWDAVGGAAGLFEIFQTVGSAQVKSLARIVGEGMSQKTAYAQEVDKLVQALLFDPSIFQEGTQLHRSPRRLPFGDVHPLLQACSESFLLEVSAYDSPSPLLSFFKVLAKCRPNLLRQIATGAVTVDASTRLELLKRLPTELFLSFEPYPMQPISSLQVSEFATPGLCFCLHLIHSLRTEPIEESKLSNELILNWVVRSISDARDKGTPFSDILTLLRTAADLTPTRSKRLVPFSHPFFALLAQLWALSAEQSPGHVDNHLLDRPSRPNSSDNESLQSLIIHLIQALPHDAITPSSITTPDSPLMTLFRHLDSAIHKLKLTKLFSLYAPGIQIDLDASPASAEQWRHFRWNGEFIKSLPVDDSRWLFERIDGLGLVRRTITFRYRWGSGDILGDSNWYNIGLLKTKWEAQNELSNDNAPIANQFLAEVKAKAERERDEVPRLAWAKGAVEIVRESKNIQLLKGVSNWASRFVRDPVS
ncbi:predicted protein [Uncinocarpus reesii 1704]|uniref:Uncharacterized protein n=1 Tax=Uncinocarpus reesii (strain UAMH 1704) TaxID=336963 RepID=C4JZN4_UNCRE|nr:uncharacterized protein UREG_07635 [Uncinocarpus reesii 1704]EEP82770.1 predicted protein [Uncinocarpus reesii 1704]